MPDYRKYCSVAGITNAEMVEALKAQYPKYSKSTQSMVCNPDDYAVQLTDEAEELLVDKFGYAPGLSQQAPKNHENKAKPYRLYVRINDELKGRLDGVKSRMGFATDQDLIEAALWQFCDRYAATLQPVMQRTPERRAWGQSFFGRPRKAGGK